MALVGVALRRQLQLLLKLLLLLLLRAVWLVLGRWKQSRRPLGHGPPYCLELRLAVPSQVGPLGPKKIAVSLAGRDGHWTPEVTLPLLLLLPLASG